MTDTMVHCSVCGRQADREPWGVRCAACGHVAMAPPADRHPIPGSRPVRDVGGPVARASVPVQATLVVAVLAVAVAVAALAAWLPSLGPAADGLGPEASPGGEAPLNVSQILLSADDLGSAWTTTADGPPAGGPEDAVAAHGRILRRDTASPDMVSHQVWRFLDGDRATQAYEAWREQVEGPADEDGQTADRPPVTEHEVGDASFSWRAGDGSIGHLVMLHDGLVWHVEVRGDGAWDPGLEDLGGRLVALADGPA